MLARPAATVPDITLKYSANGAPSLVGSGGGYGRFLVQPRSVSESFVKR
jgi:hypothetical protein